VRNPQVWLTASSASPKSRDSSVTGVVTSPTWLGISPHRLSISPSRTSTSKFFWVVLTKGHSFGATLWVTWLLVVPLEQHPSALYIPSTLPEQGKFIRIFVERHCEFYVTNLCEGELACGRECAPHSLLAAWVKPLQLTFRSICQWGRSKEDSLFGVELKIGAGCIAGWLLMLAKVQTSGSSPVWAIVLPRSSRLMALSVSTVALVCLCRASSSTVPHTSASLTQLRACCQTPRTHPSSSHGLLLRQVLPWLFL